jgi:membrane protein DedA with SNARE-associated domain
MNISRICLGRFILVFCLIAASQLHICSKDASSRVGTYPVADNDSKSDQNQTLMPDQKTSTHNRLIEDLLHATDNVQPLLDRYGYPLVFLAVLVEGFGVVAPGQTILMAASFAAARGDLNLIWVLLLTFTAAILGNSLGYLIGLKGGRPLLLRLRVKKERLQRLEGYFSRYGKGVIIFGRFFDVLRQLNGIMAGILHMPWKTFTICNILGATLWTGTWGLGSYLLEKEIAKIHLPIHLVEPLIAIMIFLGVLAFFIYILWPVRKTTS